MDDHWEQDIAELLAELSATQSELLKILSEKRTLLATGDNEALVDLQPMEDDLTERLGNCHRRRAELLAKAADESLPSDSILSLANRLPSERRRQVLADIDDARSRARLLQHESLTNWVVTQRTLLHLSQMIEIIATGGRNQPTYGEGASDTGALVDRAV